MLWAAASEHLCFCCLSTFWGTSPFSVLLRETLGLSFFLLSSIDIQRAQMEWGCTLEGSSAPLFAPPWTPHWIHDADLGSTTAFL